MAGFFIKVKIMNTDIKAIIGLGNPGPKFQRTRHNIGFMVIDELAQKYGAHWSNKGNFESADITISDKNIILIKPMTFMNTSGQIIPTLLKKGIKAENILVIHDELEKPFGSVSSKLGGSARGHNGLRSIIGVIGDQFYRIRCGIGRPEHKEDVPDFVLQNFNEVESAVQGMVDKAVAEVEKVVQS